MESQTAPWFYRHRFIVFGLAYGVAFFFGFLIVGIAGIPTTPTYRAFGSVSLFASIAAIIAIAGFAMRLWGSSYLGAAIVWRSDPQASHLRVSGPYRFTRNPLYLGNILQAIALGLLMPWPVFVLLSVGVVALDYGLIVVEEKFLAATDGEAYARYLETVPRLVPIPGKVAPSGDQRASLGSGLRTEAAIGIPALILFAALFLHSIFKQG